MHQVATSDQIAHLKMQMRVKAKALEVSAAVSSRFSDKTSSPDICSIGAEQSNQSAPEQEQLPKAVAQLTTAYEEDDDFRIADDGLEF